MKSREHDLSEIVRTHRVRPAGHVLRIPESRPASVALNWLTETGRRPTGRPQKTWQLTFQSISKN